MPFKFFIIEKGEGKKFMFQKLQGNLYKTSHDEFAGYDNHSISSLIRRGQVPVSQKQIAANYTVIKRIFGFSAIHSKISTSELSLLNSYNLKPLEETTAAGMVYELEMLNKWSKEDDAIKNRLADNIFEVRVKELRFLRSNNSSAKLSEFYDGYKALEKYVEYIAG